MKSVEDQMNNSDDKVKKLSGSLSGDMLSSITSLISKFALLAGAQQLFDRLVNSNQNSADTFGEYMYAAKTAVNAFFYTITTGDFTIFQNGLDNLIGRARAAAAAIDQLGNTVMSYNIINAQAQSKIKAARAVLYDPDATKEQKEKAKQDLKDAYKEIKDAAEIAVGDTADEIKKIVEAEANVTLSDEGAMSLIDKWLTMDARKGREKYKQEAEEEAKLREKALSEAIRRHTIKQPSGTTSFGAVITTDVIDDAEALKREIDGINKQYENGLVYKTLLSQLSDEELDKLGKQRIAMIQFADATSEAAAQAGEITKQLNNQLKPTTPKITEPELKVKPIDLTINPIDLGRTEKELEDEIAELKRRIKETPPGVLRIIYETNLAEKEQELKDFGKTPLQKEIELKAANLDLSGVQNADLTIGIGDKTEILKKNKEGIDEVLQSSEQLYSVWKGIGDSFESGNVIEKFFAIADAISTTIDSVQNLIQGFEQVGEAVNTLSAIYEAASQRKQANDSAETAGNIRKASASASAAVAEGTSKAVSSSTTWWEAIAAISAMIAAITAALSLMGTFKNGGIVGKYAGGGMIQGSTTIGDYQLARVNAGEMVLNKGQQGRLFRILNGELPTGHNNVSGNVEFHISGNELVGVLRNYENRRNKII